MLGEKVLELMESWWSEVHDPGEGCASAKVERAKRYQALKNKRGIPEGERASLEENAVVEATKVRYVKAVVWFLRFCAVMGFGCYGCGREPHSCTIEEALERREGENGARYDLWKDGLGARHPPGPGRNGILGL